MFTDRKWKGWQDELGPLPELHLAGFSSVLIHKIAGIYADILQWGFARAFFEANR